MDIKFVNEYGAMNTDLACDLRERLAPVLEQYEALGSRPEITPMQWRYMRCLTSDLGEFVLPGDVDPELVDLLYGIIFRAWRVYRAWVDANPGLSPYDLGLAYDFVIEELRITGNEVTLVKMFQHHSKVHAE